MHWWKLSAQLHSFLSSIDTLHCGCIFESTLLSTEEINLVRNNLYQLNYYFFPSELLPWTHRTSNTLPEVNQEILWGPGQRYKRHWEEMLDDTIAPFFPFFFIYTPARTPPHTHTRTHCFSNNIHKRLFHQIRSHSPFRYQDELLMCLSAEDKCAKSDSTQPVSKRMPSVRRMCLSLMYSHRVRCWQRSATFNRSLAWHMSKHYGETAQMLTSACCETFNLVYTRGEGNRSHCILIQLWLCECFSFLYFAFSCPSG